MKTRKDAYLTFDDGPNEATKLILDILARYKVVGTFFMLEPQIRSFPETACRIISEGHAAGLHGVTHKVSKFYASSKSVIREMNTTRKTLIRVTGMDTVLIRTPYGSVPHMKDSYYKAVKRAGYKLWDWNVDSKDWKYPDIRLVDLVKTQVNKIDQSGDTPIILLHDRPETAQLLPKIIDFLIKRGYQLKSLNASLTPITRKRRK